jgi:hypothetical protein
MGSLALSTEMANEDLKMVVVKYVDAKRDITKELCILRYFLAM